MTAPDTALAVAPPRRPWLAFIAVTVPLFLLMVDFSGVVVALPDIGADLGGNTGQLGWVLNAFAIGSSAPVLALGRLGDLKGRKLMVLIGVVAFAACSLLTAVAPSMPVLIGARLAAGVAGSMFFATSLAIVSNTFPGERRATAIGLWGGIGGVGSAVGPLVAGVITETFGWRWFFALNVPLLLAAAVLVATEVVESRDETTNGVDWVGFALVTGGLVGFVFGLQQAVDLGFSSPQVYGSLVSSVVLLAAFVRYEHRSANPLVDLALFKTRTYLGAVGIAAAANWSFGVVMFFVTLYLQHLVGDSAGTTGVVFLAYSIPFALLGAVSGMLARRLGAPLLLAVGMGLVAASTTVLAGVDSVAAMGLVLGGLLLSGLGQGLAFNLSTATGMGAVDESKAGVASGMINTVRMVGYSVGVAVTSIIAGSSVDGVGPTNTDAFLDGMRSAMLVTTAVALLGLPLAWLVWRGRARPPST